MFLVTPPQPNVEPLWSEYERIYSGLLADHPDTAAVAEHLGVSMGELIAFKYAPPKFGW